MRTLEPGMGVRRPTFLSESCRASTIFVREHVSYEPSLIIKLPSSPCMPHKTSFDWEIQGLMQLHCIDEVTLMSFYCSFSCIAMHILLRCSFKEVLNRKELYVHGFYFVSVYSNFHSKHAQFFNKTLQWLKTLLTYIFIF